MELQDFDHIRQIKNRAKYGRVFSAIKGENKFIIKEFIFSRGGKLAFEKEKRIVGFEGIPPLEAYFEYEKKAYIVRKYIDSLSLKKLISRKFFFTRKSKYAFYFDIIKQLNNILERLHSQGIIHNDIRPSNILIEHGSGKVYLIDFATAKIPEIPVIDSFSLIFSPPESILKIVDLINPSTDFFLVAVSLWVAINSGKVPYYHRNPEILINAQLNLPLPKTGSLSSAMYDFINKATFKTPFPKPPRFMERKKIFMHISNDQNKRFFSAADFNKELEKVIITDKQ